MPAYSSTGFQPQKLINPGQPAYSIGSFDDKQATCKFNISKVAVATNVVTITGVIVEGNIPAVGQLISIQGLQSNSGAINVSNVALTGVTITSSTGAGTMTFSLSTANLSTTNDGGQALIKVAEINEDVGQGAYIGQAFALASYVGIPSQGRAITWMYSWGTAPTSSVTIALEGAEKLGDFDAGLGKTLDSGTSVSGGETRVLQVPTTVNFLRVHITAMSTSADAKGVAKILA